MRNISILNFKILFLSFKTSVIQDKKELYIRVCHNFDKYTFEFYFSIQVVDL